MKKLLPNFLCIGVEKGGTTWLHAQLKLHPDIFLPDTKEVHFFNRYSSNFVERDNYKLGLKWYADFFNKFNGQKACGEITPMYICDPEAPIRIHKEIPDAKLIVMLRNPVNRAYSHYWMAKNKQHTNLSFDEVIAQQEDRFIKRGLYAQQLATYYKLFKADQIKVVFFEQVMKDPEYWLNDICKFLGVGEDFYKGNENIHKKIYEASVYKSPALLNLQNNLAHKLRKVRLLGKIINLIKSTGITGMLKKVNRVEQSYEKITAQQADELKKYYAEDTTALAAMLNTNIPY